MIVRREKVDAAKKAPDERSTLTVINWQTLCRRCCSLIKAVVRYTIMQSDLYICTFRVRVIRTKDGMYVLINRALSIRIFLWLYWTFFVWIVLMYRELFRYTLRPVFNIEEILSVKVKRSL